MSEAWRVASITAFEQVPVDSGALLRVAAASSITARPADPRPELLADDGYGVWRFEALPAPPDTGGELRAGFSVPEEACAPDTVFSLALDDGNVIALPSPAGSGPLSFSPVAAPPAGAFAEAAPDTLLDLLLDAAEARAELAATRELTALRPARAPRSAPTGDPAGRLAELEIWSSELERRLAEATTALAETQAELEDHRRAALVAGAEAGELTARERVLIESAALHEAQRRAERDLADAAS